MTSFQLYSAIKRGCSSLLLVVDEPSLVSDGVVDDGDADGDDDVEVDVDVDVEVDGDVDDSLLLCCRSREAASTRTKASLTVGFAFPAKGYL